MAILLIRHGETAGNRNRVVQVPETPLSEHGLDQAARLAERLGSSPVAEIWTSPQPRARMTAAAIERATGIAAREDPELEERNFGAIRGTPYAELGFDLFDLDYHPPEGESWAGFHERIDRAWERVERHWLDRYHGVADAGHLALVSHGLVCRSLLERHLVVPEAQLGALTDAQGTLMVRNTSLTVIEPRDASTGRLEHRVELLACTAHLDADEPAALGAV